METGIAIVSIFFVIILYLGLIALSIFITYLIIKWAINRSKVNENLEALRMEVQRLNFYLQNLSGANFPPPVSPAPGPESSADPGNRQED